MSITSNGIMWNILAMASYRDSSLYIDICIVTKPNANFFGCIMKIDGCVHSISGNIVGLFCLILLSITFI